MSGRLVAIDARDAFEPELRGWGRYARELVSALGRLAPERGIELDVLERGGPGPELAWEQVALPRHLRRSGADLVHVPNCFLPLRRPCPGVVTVHDLAFETFPEDFARRTAWKYRTFTPRAVRSAERVICDTEFTRDDLVRRYGADPERIRVIGLAPALPVGEEEPPPGPYVLAVGDLRKKKNLPRLAQAFRRLHDEGLPHRLVLCGVDSGESERVRAEAGPAPVELAGYVSDERLDALMRGADLLVHPSLHEGFGLAPVEAMARGCPVAVSNTTSLPEATGGAGLEFDPVDVGDIASAMRRALGDPALRASLVERGRRHAATLSWERSAQATLGVYEELVG